MLNLGCGCYAPRRRGDHHALGLKSPPARCRRLPVHSCRCIGATAAQLVGDWEWECRDFDGQGSTAHRTVYIRTLALLRYIHAHLHSNLGLILRTTLPYDTCGSLRSFPLSTRSILTCIEAGWCNNSEHITYSSMAG